MEALRQTPYLIGRVLDDQFRLEHLLGRGAMGEVYLAEQLEVERRVVIKLLNAPQFAQLQHEERFKHEARALAQLNHPNVVHLYTFGRTNDGIAYLAMEYVDGRTLASVVAAEGALPESMVLGILDQLCSALAAAHRRGVIHRDLKPDNVMLTDRHDDHGHHDQGVLVKVLDFGIAKLTHDSARKLTLKGQVMGTPLYMAPEQLRGAPADARADIYSLGVIAYELLTGQLPFESESITELFARVLNERPMPLRLKRPGLNVSPKLEALVLRCLAKDPSERFDSAVSLRQALAAIGRTATPARDVPAPRRALPQQPTQHASRDDGDELDMLAWRTIRRRSRVRAWAWAVLPLLMISAVAAASSLDVLPHPETGISALQAKSQQDGTKDAEPSEPLQLREWVQGIPFPIGSEYVNFSSASIEANVPASARRVLAFYRSLLANHWGGLRESGDGLTFMHPRAPVLKLTVTQTRTGSHIYIARRTPRNERTSSAVVKK